MINVCCRVSKISEDFKIISKIPPCSCSLPAQVEKLDAWQEGPRGEERLLLSDPVHCSQPMRVLELLVDFQDHCALSKMFRCYQPGNFYTEQSWECCIVSRKIINMIYVDLGLFRRVHSQCNIQYLFNILSDINYIPRQEIILSCSKMVLTINSVRNRERSTVLFGIDYLVVHRQLE